MVESIFHRFSELVLGLPRSERVGKLCVGKGECLKRNFSKAFDGSSKFPSPAKMFAVRNFIQVAFIDSP